MRSTWSHLRGTAGILFCLVVEAAVTQPCLAQAAVAGTIQSQADALSPGLLTPAPLPAPSETVAPAGTPLLRSPGSTLAGPLDLPGAVALALGVNPEIQSANAALLNAEGTTGVTLAARKPTVTALLGANAYSNGLNAENGTHVEYASDQLLPEMGALATLPVDISGYLRAATNAAKFDEIAARLDVNTARNDVVSGVQTAFYNLLRSEALVNVAREDVQYSQAELTDAREKFAHQTVGILDVVRAQTDLAVSRQRLISAQDQMELDSATLSNAIGLDINTPLVVTDAGAVLQPPGVAPPQVPPVTPEEAPGPNMAAAGVGPAVQVVPGMPPLPPIQGATGQAPPPLGADQSIQADETEAEAVANQIGKAPADADTLPEASFNPSASGPVLTSLVVEGVATRPEVLSAQAEVAAAKQGIRFAKRSSLPSFATGLRYEYAAQTFGTSVELNNLQAFVGVTIPLSDGGLSRARVKQAQGDQASAEVDERRTVDSVTLDIKKAYLSLLDARARVAVANQSLAQAREGFLVARIRYNAGVTSHAGLSPLLELSDAQVALVQAESDQVGAVYDYNVARVQLDYAVGGFSYNQPGPGFPSAGSATQAATQPKP